MVEDPGGEVGHLLGWIGVFLMILTIPFSFRKRVGCLGRLGSLKGWLYFHIIVGTVGPILIVVHSAGKTRGIAGFALWSTIFVVLSGYFGGFITGPLFEKYETSENRIYLIFARLSQYIDATHIPISILLFILTVVHIVAALLFQVDPQ
ncbi:MAG: hypothetical protein KAG61_12065 [Bacteriovoracaceae bacterium]|nr:hypothetical protein [Bacteriovoracaceae bacterium]